MKLDEDRRRRAVRGGEAFGVNTPVKRLRVPPSGTGAAQIGPRVAHGAPWWEDDSPDWAIK